jgi:hypothetical protein
MCNLSGGILIKLFSLLLLDLKLPYLVMFLIAGGGALSVAFLPETLGANLPESLEEASTFGTNDKFFSYLPKRDENKEKKGISLFGQFRKNVSQCYYIPWYLEAI